MAKEGSAPVVYVIEAESAAAVAALDAAIAGMEGLRASAERASSTMPKLDAASKAAAKAAAAAAKEQERAAREAAKALEDMERLERKALAEIAKARAAADREQAKLEKEQERRRIAAEKAAEKVIAQQAKLEAAAKKAAAASSGSFSEIARGLNSSPLISNAEALGSVFITMGGTISKVAMAFTTLIRPLSVVGTMISATFGPAAPAILGIAALPALLLAVPAAMKGVANALMNFGREAVKAGEATKGIVDRKITTNLELLAQSFETLDKHAQVTSATLGSMLSPSIEWLIDLSIGAAEAVRFYVDALDDLNEAAKRYIDTDLADAFSKLRRVVQGVTSLGFTELARGLADVGDEAQKQTQGSLQGYLGKWKALPPVVKDVRTELELLEYAERRRAEKLDEIDKDREKAKKAQDVVNDAILFATEDILTAEGKISAAINEKIDAVYESGAAEKQVAMAVFALKQAEARQINKLYDERLEKAFKTLDAERLAAEKFHRETQAIARDMEQETIDWQKKQDKAAEKKLKEKTEAQISAAFQIADAWAEATKQIADMIQESSAQDLERLDMREKRTRRALRNSTEEERKQLEARLDAITQEQIAERKAARESFNISQAAATAGVIANGAAAFAALLVSLAALGPGAPIAAAAIVGPSIAAQLAVIGNNKPPAHSGAVLGADEMYMGNQMVRQGESMVIFNQRATEQGAAEQAATMNRADGGAGRAGGSPAAVQLVLADAGRVIGQAAIRESGRSGSPLRKAFGKAPKGSIDPYRRR